jgi:Domain of unknown function (DUF1996)
MTDESGVSLPHAGCCDVLSGSGRKPKRRTRRRPTALIVCFAVALALVGCIKPLPNGNGDPEYGSFRVECQLSHRAQVDPIVAPRQNPYVAGHMHDFYGNSSTNAFSTYSSMLSGSTNCTNSLDKAGYWVPTLSKNGVPVPPDISIFYYRNRPVEYSQVVPFPPDFKMIAGGANAFPNSYWTCDGESDTGFQSRRNFIPNCGSGGQIKLHVFFPSCWDGIRLDSPNHRDHVAYGLDGDTMQPEGTDPDLCPASHPVKIPHLDFRVQYDLSDGTGAVLSDGTLLPHADFWNTWVQSELERGIHECLGRVGRSCDLL